MASKEEYTFSELMGILTDIEERVSKLYEKMAQKIEDVKLKDLFLSFSKKSLQQTEKITETRRKTVTEMTLEPITGLKIGEKLAEIDNMFKSEEFTFDKLVKLENVLSELYKNATKKVSHISADVSFLLDNLSKEHKKRENAIKNFN